MKQCIGCGKPTEGSIGAAGIKWDCICQPCKDEADNRLKADIALQAAAWGKAFAAFRAGPTPEHTNLT